MDNESDAALMLMDLEAYEKMLGNYNGVEKLTEEELLEKINRDVAIWRAHNDKELAETYDKVIEKAPPAQPATPTPSPAPVYVPKQEEVTPSSVGSAVGRENNTITLNKYDNINAEQEHSAGDIVAEEEEEKFYLEPVE